MKRVLPKYIGGKTVIGSNVLMNDDNTFVDDYTRAFDDLIITPNGPRVKPALLYKYLEPWDDEKFLNAVTVGGLNNLMPSQWIRRGYDLATGNLTTDSWLNGNAGVVPNSYAKEHPLMAMAANGLVDFWTLGGPKLLKSALSTGTKLNPVLFTKYEPQPVQEPLVKPQLAPKQFEIEEIPGYQLKSLMRGNALEKQLSKQGTISINSIRAHANKASEVEKSVINKILSSEEFAGLKSVDYNKFRRAVHNNLITYDRTPDARYEDYGLNRLGISSEPVYQDEPDLIQRYNDIITRKHNFELQHNIPRVNRRSTQELIDAAKRWKETPEGIEYHNILNEFDRFILEHPNFTTVDLNSNARRRLVGHSGDGATLNTYTFSSKEIPLGDSKHYEYNTLGHSRTYTTEKEPEVLHVMESLSDWGQHPLDLRPEHHMLEANMFNLDENGNIILNDSGKRYINSQHSEFAQEKYLHDNYITRQIQENLKYAAERGLSKMRYPTPDTAAKIEGYQKQSRFGLGNMTDIRYNDVTGEFEPANGDVLMTDYSPLHKTILKKYADFPKQFKKLHKNAEVREVTDEKGNTWYEVDVPKDFLKKEWMYGIGAATMLKPRKQITE